MPQSMACQQQRATAGTTTAVAPPPPPLQRRTQCARCVWASYSRWMRTSACQPAAGPLPCQRQTPAAAPGTWRPAAPPHSWRRSSGAQSCAAGEMSSFCKTLQMQIAKCRLQVAGTPAQCSPSVHHNDHVTCCAGRRGTRRCSARWASPCQRRRSCGRRQRCTPSGQRSQTQTGCQIWRPPASASLTSNRRCGRRWRRSWAVPWAGR